MIILASLSTALAAVGLAIFVHRTGGTILSYRDASSVFVLIPILLSAMAITKGNSWLVVCPRYL